MSIFEKEYILNKDERNTLLFLTGQHRLLKYDELSDAEINNIFKFFNINKNVYKFIKIIIFKDKVVLKLKGLN